MLGLYHMILKISKQVEGEIISGTKKLTILGLEYIHLNASTKELLEEQQLKY